MKAEHGRDGIQQDLGSGESTLTLAMWVLGIISTMVALRSEDLISQNSLRRDCSDCPSRNQWTRDGARLCTDPYLSHAGNELVPSLWETRMEKPFRMLFIHVREDSGLLRHTTKTVDTSGAQPKI